MGSWGTGSNDSDHCLDLYGELKSRFDFQDDKQRSKGFDFLEYMIRNDKNIYDEPADASDREALLGVIVCLINDRHILPQHLALRAKELWGQVYAEYKTQGWFDQIEREKSLNEEIILIKDCIDVFNHVFRDDAEFSQEDIDHAFEQKSIDAISFCWEDLSEKGKEKVMRSFNDDKSKAFVKEVIDAMGISLDFESMLEEISERE